MSELSRPLRVALLGGVLLLALALRLAGIGDLPVDD